MADNHSKEVRSMNMSHIKSTGTKPEVIVRKYLFSKGLRYRKNDKRYPGNPDILFFQNIKYACLSTAAFGISTAAADMRQFQNQIRNIGFLNFKEMLNAIKPIMKN